MLILVLARPEVCPLHAAMSRAFTEESTDPLWSKTRECVVEDPQPIFNKSDRFWIFLFWRPAHLHLHPVQILPGTRG